MLRLGCPVPMPPMLPPTPPLTRPLVDGGKRYQNSSLLPGREAGGGNLGSTVWRMELPGL